ncbi:RipA family octameric membrane protein [Agarivorans sp. Z349TD_8]|uniref:RipA family octameric membrane protein n=1 Tax=Agarivorans sp. Z349TD_8 TaxID=3421434 RepID=UPI003D7EA628
MNQNDYDKNFETDDSKSKKLKAAFEQVSDIRKFEIELYWKRATYFWALITVAFAGYFSILASEHMPNKFFLSLIVSCVGFVFTFAWFLSSRGSKYWQENWENHLDLLENKVTGPLYKTLLERPEHSNFVEKYVTGPMSVSVSKINQWVSVFVVFSWLSLAAFSGYKSISPLAISTEQWLSLSAHAAVILVALLSCLLMFGFGKTHKEKHSPRAVERETKIG